MRSFEQAFRIPAGHRLEQVRTRARGGIIKGTYWDHDEYDATGHLVARYHSFVELGENGEYCCGWRKYNRAGTLVDAEDLVSSRKRTLFDNA